MSNVLLDEIIILKKYPGKGGWTYAEIKTVSQNKSNPFGWIKVKGMIDDFPLNQYKLMPMGEGKLFLPVKAEIRKIIGKEAGDKVHVILYYDNDPLTIPSEILECFESENKVVLQRFKELSEGGQKRYLDWIYAAKTDKTKAERIVMLINDMLDQYHRFV